jgi:anthranilate synthase/aminodeoxychorismate synthase-like glutamine amidotransferase
MWVLIDNYDSFTYILLDYLLQTGNECSVFRNDELSVAELENLTPDRIIISPGPETPLQAGICMDVIEEFHARTPILGVCLGHQALGMYFGGKLVYAPYPMHGKTSEVRHNGHEIFDNIESPCTVMRYHSLSIEGIEGTGLKEIARSNDDKQLMAMMHEQHPCVGIQFHPESVGTTHGLRMIKNWASMRFQEY